MLGTRYRVKPLDDETARRIHAGIQNLHGLVTSLAVTLLQYDPEPTEFEDDVQNLTEDITSALDVASLRDVFS